MFSLFDRKLSFIHYIEYLKAKCLNVLNLLKVLSNRSWVQTELYFSSRIGLKSGQN